MMGPAAIALLAPPAGPLMTNDWLAIIVALLADGSPDASEAAKKIATADKPDFTRLIV